MNSLRASQNNVLVVCALSVSAIVCAAGAARAVPTVSIDDVTHDEADSGNTAFTFTVSISEADTVAIIVDFDTTDNTATTANNDYTTKSTTLTFAANTTTLSQTVTVNVKGDN